MYYHYYYEGSFQFIDVRMFVLLELISNTFKSTKQTKYFSYFNSKLNNLEVSSKSNTLPITLEATNKTFPLHFIVLTTRGLVFAVVFAKH